MRQLSLLDIGVIFVTAPGPMSVKNIHDAMSSMDLPPLRGGLCKAINRLRDEGFLLENTRGSIKKQGGTLKIYRATKSGRNAAVIALNRLAAVMEKMGS